MEHPHLSPVCLHIFILKACNYVEALLTLCQILPLQVLTQAHVILRSSQGEGSMYVLHPLVRDVLASDAAGYISARSERYEAARARFVEHFGALFQRVGREYACNAVAGDAHSKFLAHRHSIDAMMRWVGTPAQPPHCEALYCSLLWSSWDMLQQLLRLPELEVFTRQCVAMAQDVDDKPAEAQALVMDAWVLVQHGRYQAALEELDRASEILQVNTTPVMGSDNALTAQ